MTFFLFSHCQSIQTDITCFAFCIWLIEYAYSAIHTLNFKTSVKLVCFLAIVLLGFVVLIDLISILFKMQNLFIFKQCKLSLVDHNS